MPLSPFLERTKTLMVKTVGRYVEAGVPRLSAGMSFYAMLAFAPVLVLLTAVAGSILGEGSARDTILREVHDAMGEDIRVLVEGIINKTNDSGAGPYATIISIGVAFFTASGLFIVISQIFHVIWGVKPLARGFIKGVILQRLVAFVCVFTFGMLMIAWLILDSWLAWAQRNATPGISLGQTISFLGSATFLTIVCAIAFKSWPRGMAAWRDVWIGALVAGIGVALTKFVLSEYFSRIDVAGAFGPAGALIVILLWIYYTAQVTFFGAVMVYAYAHLYGSHKPVPDSTGTHTS